MQIKQTAGFVAWLRKLKDIQGRARILQRLDRLAAGNPGDHRQLPGGISELRLAGRATAFTTPCAAMY